MEVLGAFSGAVDRHAHEHGGRTDLGEMAQMAGDESLSALVGPNLTSLFGAGPEDVQRAVGRFASGDRFSLVISGDHQNKPDIGSNIVRQWLETQQVDVVADVPTSSVAFAVQNLTRERNRIFRTRPRARPTCQDRLVCRRRSTGPMI